MGSVIPEKTKETARAVVRKVVDDLMKKLGGATQQAISGSLNQAPQSPSQTQQGDSWNETIRKNLKHYQVDYETIIPETRIGYGRKEEKR